MKNNLKKAKVIVGICLLVQTVAFFVLFLVYWNKKRSFAKTMGVFAAVGGGLGGFLLYNASTEEKKKKITSADDVETEEDEFEDPFDADDIFCDFENGDENSAEAE